MWYSYDVSSNGNSDPRLAVRNCSLSRVFCSFLHSFLRGAIYWLRLWKFPSLVAGRAHWSRVLHVTACQEAEGAAKSERRGNGASQGHAPPPASTNTYFCRWIPPLKVSKTSQNSASAGAQHSQECISFWGGGIFQTQTIMPNSFDSKKNLGYTVSVLLCNLYSEDSKMRKFLGEKNHLQLSTTWACKLVGSHLFLSYKQAKSLKGFNFPAWGVVMGLLYQTTSKVMAS